MSLLFIGWWWFLYYNKTIDVRYDLVFVRKMPSGKKLEPIGVTYIYSSALNEGLFDRIGDSTYNNVLINFSNADFIVTYGAPLKKVIYYVHRQNPEDECDYLRKVPLSTPCRENYTDSIYFYRIEKGKYRCLCP